MGQPSDSLCSARVAADSKYLYFELRDPKGADPKWHRQDDFEIFMPADKSGYPHYQICISPKGEIGGYTRTKQGDKITFAKYDFNMKSYNKIEKDGSWVVRLAVPRNRLPIKNDILKINFFRTEKTGHGTFKGWNPILTGRYLEGMDRAGSIMLFPKVIQENEFYCYDKRECGNKMADKDSDNGRTAWINWGKDWYLRYNTKATFPAVRCQFSVRVRAKMQTPAANASFVIGIYDMKTKKNVITRRINVKDCEGDKFKEIVIGTCNMGDKKSFYVSGFTPKDAKGMIFVDSLKFSVPKKK